MVKGLDKQDVGSLTQDFGIKPLNKTSCVLFQITPMKYPRLEITDKAGAAERLCNIIDELFFPTPVLSQPPPNYRNLSQDDIVESSH